MGVFRVSERLDNATLAERSERALSRRERRAAVLLFEDGYAHSELAMVLQTAESTIRRALRYEGAER